MTVVTRFAPSPTGFLHIGGARTALFNWLFARHHGGKYLLRIEDTDRKRSTDEAVAAIIDGLSWLGLEADGPPVSQLAHANRHADIARQMLAAGNAYHCYCSPDELSEMREAAKRDGRPVRYDGRWRDRGPADAPAGIQPVVRLRAPVEGETVIADLVQGEVRVANEQLDDMVLLRADGTPTYMLAVVVDDHDMGITHVIRGDDHLTNAFRQTQIYRAMGWDVPEFAHVPLIHGPDGAKMSKRHGALGVDAYRGMGFLPEALCNYLLRLGWSHGDDEMISTAQAIDWFDLAAIGKSAARFDFAKLTNINGHYIRNADDQRLCALVLPLIAAGAPGGVLSGEAPARLKSAMAELKERAKTLLELAESGAFYARMRPVPMTPKAAKQLDADGLEVLRGVRDRLLSQADDWTASGLDGVVRQLADARGLKLGQIAQPLRAALAGAVATPGIFEVLAVLGRNESLGRIDDALAGLNPAQE